MITGRPLIPVHPRGGGELKQAICQRGMTHGSSPRGRGTLAYEVKALIADRFIPAGAGNSSKEATGTLTYPVHPRGGGEL